ncbi:MAG: FlgD immunoglobulin-like domain containing protein [Thermoleophilia bacterium]
MARFLSTLLVLFLLGGTAAAFAITEGLKLEASPITGTSVVKIFSPRCECDKDTAAVDFKLRTADRLTIAMIDANGREVRRLVERARFPRGWQTFVWNGRTDDGAIAADGEYRPRVHLARAHQTIVLPNPIRVDTTPPQTTLISVSPHVLTPLDRKAKVRYKVSEPARGVVYVDGHRAVVSLFHPLEGKVDLYLRVHGGDLARGPHRVTVGAVDLAGNVGPASPPQRIVVRYVELARKALTVRAGGVIAVRYSPRGTVRWRLDGRTGISRRGIVRIRAPLAPGRYGLFVLQDGHADRAIVTVAP